NICPTCGGSISQKEAKIIIEKNQKIIIENNKKLKDIDEKVKKYQTIVLPEQQKVDILQKEIALLEKKTQNYQIILEELNKLEAYKSFYLKLTQSEATLKAQTEAISDLQKIYKAKQLELEKSSNYANDLETYSKKLLETEEILINKNNKKSDLTEKLMELRSKYGQAITLVSRVTQMEQLFKQKTNEKSSLTKDKEVFEELSLAFGKKGIQAMIIEGAIPEIEDEANRLLDKLTEGRMKISLETQKETKTKVLTIDGTKERSLVETLDIIISDEMGERSYELYSGGEAFRVNIAIRLAISKLLSNRAGARLQFLVIDEGFGTQDAQGRTRLIEILDAIKDDFEKIVIITHLEELKEEFPVRIEVQKGPTGSTFEVVGI
ncbi:MAG: SMC domain protein, partial [Candidatus Daviesbacteria bacterium GW2011_GWA1_36_8]